MASTLERVMPYNRGYISDALTARTRLPEVIVVDFSGGEESLRIFSVDHIAVYVHIKETVIGADTLCLIIELFRRRKIVDSHVGEDRGILENAFCSEIFTGREVDFIHTVQVVGLSV